MPDSLNFLVALPYMRNVFFEKTVVLMLDDRESGALGLVVNFPSAVPIDELLESAPIRGSAWVGGPVEPYVGWCLYRRPTGMRGERKLSESLYMSTSAEVLDILQMRGQDFRLLMGYVGWEPNRLQWECEAGFWAWLNADARLIFETTAEVCWETAYKRLGISPGSFL